MCYNSRHFFINPSQVAGDRQFAMSSSQNITRLLTRWSAGDAHALDELLPLVYEELRRIAGSYMRHENPQHMLQTTALVHEAYLRLVEQRNAQWQSRVHFFAVAASIMRRILVDYARGVKRVKRGQGVVHLPISDVAVLSEARADELIAVNSALEKLTNLDPRKSRVFELRYFGGMSVDEAADALQVSSATVARDWRMAKTWLRRELAMEAANGS
jgi:RNA polymerase sigma factor (TIGR02999 family)